MDFMNPETLAVAAFVIIVVYLSLTRRRPAMPLEAFVSFRKPTLWWIVDAEPNARNSFNGARNSSEPNRGYLQLALEAVQKTQGADFAVTPLVGRPAILAQIPGADPSAAQLPASLWRAYAISRLLEAQGGLVMDGNSTLCVGPRLLPLLQADAVVFGVHPEEPVANPLTAMAPGPAPYVAYASKPHLPAWRLAADTWETLVRRGPQAWSSATARRTDMTVWEAQKPLGIAVVRGVDGGRLSSGLPRALEDTFGRVSVPADPKTALTPETVFVTYDGDELARRYEFNWVLRLSSQQLKESDLAFTKWAGY